MTFNRGPQQRKHDDCNIVALNLQLKVTSKVKNYSDFANLSKPSSGGYCIFIFASTYHTTYTQTKDGEGIGIKAVIFSIMNNYFCFSFFMNYDDTNQLMCMCVAFDKKTTK
jgi:hypothetical protein